MEVVADLEVAADLEAVAVLAAAVAMEAVVAMEAAVDMVVVAIVEAEVEAIMAAVAMDTSPPMRCMWLSLSTVAAEEVAIMAAAVEAVVIMAAAVEAIQEAAAIMAVVVAADRNGAVEEAVAVEVRTPAAAPIATATVPAEERMPMPRHRLTPMEVAGRTRQMDDSIETPRRDEFNQFVCVVEFFLY